MTDESTGGKTPQDAEIAGLLVSVRRRLGRLLVAVSLMTLALILTVAAVFGYLVHVFAGDAMLWGGCTAGAAVLGFFFGFFAGRKV